MRSFLLFAVLLLGPVAAADLWVAPDAPAGGTGSKEQPFATLEQARDALRQKKPADAVTVWLRGGVYNVRRTLTLQAQDSGTAAAPIVYSGVAGEKVTLYGGTRLQREWFAPVTDEAILQRVISPQARPLLLQADLKAHGITDYGELSRRGFHKANAGKTPPVELYIGGQRMTRGRWPNPEETFPQYLRKFQKDRKGAVARSGVIEKGPTGNDADFMERGGTFSYEFDRPALWTKAEDIWLDGVFAWSWEWSYNKIAKIDTEHKQITLRYGEMAGLTDQYSGDYFFAENLLEEIDQPGEYYLDRQSGLLYLLPTAQFGPDTTVELSQFTSPMVVLRDASHITFRNLHFDLSRGTGLACSGGEGVVVERCAFSRLSGTAVSLNGRNHGVRACHIHHVGGAGVGLSGGKPDTLEPSGCFVEDSDLHDFAWYSKVYTPAVSLGYRSVGSRVSHNRIARGPHVAIVVYGNDHLIEYNDIGRVVEDFTDMGAIYANLGAYPLERGTVIRRNYFHDLGQEHHLQNGVYPDNQTMGWLIEENVFARIGGKGEAANCRAVNLNTTSHMIVRNNVFVDCTVPCLMGAYSAATYDRAREGWEQYFKQHDLSKLPHAQKYPELLKFWDEPRQYPDSNVFERNLIYNPSVPLLKQWGKAQVEGGTIIEAGGSLQKRDNWVAEGDPGFVDAALGDYSFKPDAAALSRINGFKAIPFREIGPRGTVGVQ